MKRTHGRCPCGERVVDDAAGGARETHTMLAAIRIRGVAAAMVTKKSINSITFLGFIEQFLCPRLRQGDIVVMDNLAVHKVHGVAEAIHAVGAEAWFLPPYSPDLNPIERAWSKVKRTIRSLAPPTFRRLVRAIGQGLRQISPTECANYLASFGYAPTPSRKRLQRGEFSRPVLRSQMARIHVYQGVQQDLCALFRRRRHDPDEPPTPLRWSG